MTYSLVQVDSAHSEWWFRVDCGWCQWETTGWESVCEEAWHEHAAENHPRRYSR